LSNLSKEMANESAELTNKKLNVLQAIRDTLPDSSYLLDKCRSHMKTMTDTIDKDYLAFTEQFNESISRVPDTGDSCERVLSEVSPHLIQNQRIKNEANAEIIKVADKKSREYEAALNYMDHAMKNGAIGDDLSSSTFEYLEGSDSDGNNGSGSSESFAGRGGDGTNGNSYSLSSGGGSDGSGLRGTSASKSSGGTLVAHNKYNSSGYQGSGYGTIGSNSDTNNKAVNSQQGLGNSDSESGSGNGGVFSERLAQIEDIDLERKGITNQPTKRLIANEEVNTKLGDITLNKERSIFDIISTRYKKKIVGDEFLPTP
jgi:hypothetical protein